MERFVFLKIMNNQAQRFPSLIVAVSILCAALVVTPARGQAQGPSGADHVSVALSDPARPALVKASLVNGGIAVKGYDGKEVVVEARARSSESGRSDSNMKRIVISSTGLSVEEENNEVRISSDSVMRAIDLTISVPVHTSLKLSAVNSGDIVITGVDGELDVNDVNGSVTLNNVSGSAVAHALNGRLLATFSRVNPQKPMAFSSLNGDIDVTFPPDLKANLSLSPIAERFSVISTSRFRLPRRSKSSRTGAATAANTSSRSTRPSMPQSTAVAPNCNLQTSMAVSTSAKLAPRGDAHAASLATNHFAGLTTKRSQR